uniref:Late blight resistance protein homolog R1B-14 n=1 Tax=Nicotiana tabacum TaxID=4097 RepID=A0A1S4AWQ1_TOBAC|nr:PREDICTED: putative late blight resistance protein homolog R1B-14 [Nicotiana tabacum]
MPQICIPREFYQLFHSRYIAISGDFKELSKFFSYFWNLQTLVLNTPKPTLDIKAGIWNMSRLRHLRTNKPANFPPPTTSTSSCLQTLSLVAPESCKEDVLAKASNLKKLSIKGNMATFLETSKGEFSNFLVLERLESLTLLNDYLSRALHLPSALFVYLPKLKKLTLSKTRFEWNEANRLGHLECLEVLKLKENAFTGNSWKMEAGGFRKLQVLWIERAELVSWEASNCSFPRLRNLVFVSCLNLAKVPPELADLEYLQEMVLDNTSKAGDSAKEIERKRKEKQTPESIKFKLTISY